MVITNNRHAIRQQQHPPPSSVSLLSSSNTNTSSISNTKPKVPYFVLHLPNGKAKALFTVPSHLADVLVLHPIMARGACFELTVDVVSQGRQQQHRRRNNGNDNGGGERSSLSIPNSTTTTNDYDNNTKTDAATSFLSTEFVSPRPEETAHAIAERLQNRLQGTTTTSSNGTTSTGSMMALEGLLMGMRWRIMENTTVKIREKEVAHQNHSLKKEAFRSILFCQHWTIQTAKQKTWCIADLHTCTVRVHFYVDTVPKVARYAPSKFVDVTI